jgi:hypothetical protein
MSMVTNFDAVAGALPTSPGNSSPGARQRVEGASERSSIYIAALGDNGKGATAMMVESFYHASQELTENTNQLGM